VCSGVFSFRPNQIIWVGFALDRLLNIGWRPPVNPNHLLPFLTSLIFFCLPGQGQAQELKKHPKVKVFAKARALDKEAVSEDWTSFLGPQHNAVSKETKIQLSWPKPSGPTLLWSFAKGAGYASPAVAGTYLVYFHRVAMKEEVICLHSETGALRWTFSYPSQYKDRFGFSNGPRASPVIEGKVVYSFGVEGKLHALDLKSGKLLWKRDLHKDYKVKQGYFGATATPLIVKEGLIINLGAPGANVVAVDKSSGKSLWVSDKKWGASYASPVPATIHGQKRVLIFAGGESHPPHGGLVSVNPANGAIDFRFPFRSKAAESVNAANPIVIGQKIFITASYKTGAALISLSKDLKTAKADWTSKAFGAHFNTPIHHKGYIYGFDGRNIRNSELVCFRVSDGKEMWRETLTWKETLGKGEAKQEVDMTPARGTLLKLSTGYLCLGEFGHLLSLALSEKGPKMISRAKLFYAPETWSLPVLSRGLLYVSQHARSNDSGPPRLLCYDLRKQKERKK
jgi:outer membrane protein assembly factor BamB